MKHDTSILYSRDNQPSIQDWTDMGVSQGDKWLHQPQEAMALCHPTFVGKGNGHEGNGGQTQNRVPHKMTHPGDKIYVA